MGRRCTPSSVVTDSVAEIVPWETEQTGDQKEKTEMAVMPEKCSSAPHISGSRQSSSLQACVDVCGLTEQHMPFIHKPKPKDFTTCVLPCRKLPPPMFKFQSTDIKLKLLKERCHILSWCSLIQSVQAEITAHMCQRVFHVFLHCSIGYFSQLWAEMSPTRLLALGGGWRSCCFPSCFQHPVTEVAGQGKKQTCRVSKFQVRCMKNEAVESH